MRFVLGLIAGAALILLATGTTGAPAGDLSSRLRQGAETLWRSLVEATGGNLAQLPSRVGSADAARTPGTEAAGGSEHAAATPATSLDPLPRLAAPEPVSAGSVTAAVAAVSEPTAAAAPAIGPETIDHWAMPEPEAASEAGDARVWAPFHSEMSAAGFADLLTRELGHPFEVAREAPGRYAITFRYHDLEERKALLARVAQVTGTRL
jgi:hypothetical protein